MLHIFQCVSTKFGKINWHIWSFSDVCNVPENYELDEVNDLKINGIDSLSLCEKMWQTAWTASQA